MDEQSEKFTVTILDKEYPLEGTIEIGQMHEIESYVDRRIRELQESVPMVPIGRLAILACLNIAQELFEQKATIKARMNYYEKELNAIISAIDNVLLHN